MHNVTQRGIDRAKTTERYKNKSKKLSIDAVNHYYIYKNFKT